MALRFLNKPLRSTFTPLNLYRTISTPRKPQETDQCGIPKKPTWSVNELLSSYPQPKIGPKAMQKLYDLSALECPEEDSDFEALQQEFEEMVKLVEAVRMVDTSDVSVHGRGEIEDGDRQNLYPEQHATSGQDLLKHASRTQDNFYVVDSDRKR